MAVLSHNLLNLWKLFQLYGVVQDHKDIPNDVLVFPKYGYNGSNFFSVVTKGSLRNFSLLKEITFFIRDSAPISNAESLFCRKNIRLKEFLKRGWTSDGSIPKKGKSIGIKYENTIDKNNNMLVELVLRQFFVGVQSFTMT